MPLQDSPVEELITKPSRDRRFTVYKPTRPGQPDHLREGEKADRAGLPGDTEEPSSEDEDEEEVGQGEGSLSKRTFNFPPEKVEAVGALDLPR